MPNLDATLRPTMRSEIKALQRDTGLTTIPVTHDRIEGRIADGAFASNGTRLPVTGTAAGHAVLGIRPEDPSFAESGLHGRVIDIEPMGRETLYIVDTPLGGIRVLEAGATARRGHDETVKLVFETAATLLFDAAGQRLIAEVRVEPPA